jgi:hypothetical protein
MTQQDNTAFQPFQGDQAAAQPAQTGQQGVPAQTLQQQGMTGQPGYTDNNPVPARTFGQIPARAPLAPLSPTAPNQYQGATAPNQYQGATAPNQYQGATAPNQYQGAAVPTSQPTTGNMQEDRLIARILAALGQPQQTAANTTGQSAVPLSPEDQRLVNALAGVHSSGRNVTVVSREGVGTNLFFIEYTYSPATGTTQTVQALVYDNGTKTHVFGGR